MPRFPVHSVDDAPEAAREPLRRLQARFGKVLNIHGEMVHAPVVLAAYTGIQQAIAEHGSFGARTREAIALAVGAVDNCAYCQSAHTVAGQAVGWSLDHTIAFRDGKQIEGEDKLGALLAVARQITADVGEVDEHTCSRRCVPGGPWKSWPSCSPMSWRTCSPTTSTITPTPSWTCPPRPA